MTCLKNPKELKIGENKRCQNIYCSLVVEFSNHGIYKGYKPI